MKDITNWTIEELQSVTYECSACIKGEPVFSIEHTISPICQVAAAVEIARRIENEDKTLQRSTQR